MTRAVKRINRFRIEWNWIQGGFFIPLSIQVLWIFSFGTCGGGFIICMHVWEHSGDHPFSAGLHDDSDLIVPITFGCDKCTLELYENRTPNAIWRTCWTKYIEIGMVKKSKSACSYFFFSTQFAHDVAHERDKHILCFLSGPDKVHVFGWDAIVIE